MEFAGLETTRSPRLNGCRQFLLIFSGNQSCSRAFPASRSPCTRVSFFLLSSLINQPIFMDLPPTSFFRLFFQVLVSLSLPSLPLPLFRRQVKRVGDCPDNRNKDKITAFDTAGRSWLNDPDEMCVCVCVCVCIHCRERSCRKVAGLDLRTRRAA